MESENRVLDRRVTMDRRARVSKKPTSFSTNTRRIFLICIIIITLISIGLTVDKYYVQYQDEKEAMKEIVPLVVYGEIKILNDEPIHPGDILSYAIEYDKKMNLLPVIRRQLRNTYVYTLAETRPSEKPLGRQISWATLPIPRSAEYGTYRLYWTAIYEVWVGHDRDIKREISVSAKSEQFEIVQGKNDDPKDRTKKPSKIPK